MCISILLSPLNSPVQEYSGNTSASQKYFNSHETIHFCRKILPQPPNKLRYRHMTQTLQRRLLNLVMVMYAYNSQEMEAGRPGVHSHFQLYSKLKATLGYMKPCLRKMKKKMWRWGNKGNQSERRFRYIPDRKSHQIQENFVIFFFN